MWVPPFEGINYYDHNLFVILVGMRNSLVITKSKIPS
jgi:hypothetical protein